MTDPRKLMGGFPLTRRWAVELIADMLPVSCASKVRLHHSGTLEGILYRALWLFREPQDRFTRRVRAAYKLLDDGFDREPAAVGQVVGATTERLSDLQQTEHNLHQDAWAVDKADPDRRFRSLLALYQMTYERYYRTLAAPFVVAGRVVAQETDPQKAVGGDGRVKLNVIWEMEAGRGIADQAFTAGLNNHFRNSAAHGHFDILTEDEIRMWDLDPRSGNYSWGPQTFTYWELREQVYALSVTALVLLTAIVLFDIAHGRTMFQRGWLKPSLRPRRSDVLRSEMGQMAGLHGLEVVSVGQEDSLLRLTLRVLGNEMPDQISEVIAGGTGQTTRYAQQVKTYRAPAWKQVYGFLQMTYDLHGYYEMVEVVLEDASVSTEMGRLKAPRDVREAMVTSDIAPEDLRPRMEADTLADNEIPVVLEGVPR
ncbi:MAG: hypothetical protein HY704_05460 [Gemmatimonadetes bacterium]|nr:hypothetical protein [Gemmatimonadota bacterium]